MEKITLSPSKLSVLKDCERCFWDAEVAKVARPRGIFPSLPGGIDRIMKQFFSKHRGSLPEFLKDKIVGQLYPDLATLKRWQYWKTAPRYVDVDLNVEVYGAIDDLIVDQDGAYIPFDYKTKGSKPPDDGSQYYQLQMDIYNLLFASNGFEIKEKAYLCYLWPADAKDSESSTVVDIPFGYQLFEYQCSTQKAKDVIRHACEIMRGPRPEASLTCDYCNYISQSSAIHEIPII